MPVPPPGKSPRAAAALLRPVSLASSTSTSSTTASAMRSTTCGARAGQLGSACDRNRRTARACWKRATRHVRSTAARSDAGRPASTAEWLQGSASAPPMRAHGRRGPAGSRRYASARVTATRVPCVSQLRLLASVRSTSRTARSSALGSGSRSRPCSARKTRQRAKAAPAKRSALTTSSTVFNRTARNGTTPRADRSTRARSAARTDRRRRDRRGSSGCRASAAAS
jgi:hypothetical protein